MESASAPRLAQQSKVAVILRGIAGSGKSTEAKRIVDLAQGEGLVAKVHATNDQWWARVDQPPKCKCGVQMVEKDALNSLYTCQHGEAGCGLVGRAVEDTDGCMFLHIPTMQLEAELANLSAFMKDLESGCDVVIAENTFLNNLELYSYACAAKLAGYITYVVDMQGVDADTAAANSQRVKHVYSLQESNREVIERQISEWRPVDPAALPKQCRVIQCPYGKSKAHIVLAHIFSSEAFQSHPAAAEPVQSNSHIGQGSSAQTPALDLMLQPGSANPSPDGRASSAVMPDRMPMAAWMAPLASSGQPGQPQDRCNHDMGCQAEACAQAGEVRSPEEVSSPGVASHDAIAQEPEPAQRRQAGQLSAGGGAAEKQSGTDGEAPPDAPSSSARLQPSRRNPRLRPRREAAAAGPSRPAAAPDDEVVCLISDSEDEQPPVAGPSGTSLPAGRAPMKEDPSSAPVGPVTPPQRLAKALPPACRADSADAASPSQGEAAPAGPATNTAAPAAPPAPCRKPRSARRAAGALAAVVPLGFPGTEAVDLPEVRQKKARKRRRLAEGALQTGADALTQAAEPRDRDGAVAEAQPAMQPRRSRQQQLAFPVHKQARQGSAPEKAAPGRSAGQQSGAAVEAASERSDARGLRTRGLLEAEVAPVDEHVTGPSGDIERCHASVAERGESVSEPAESPGLEQNASAADFYMKHRGSPVTADQKGKAPITQGVKRREKWWDDSEDEEMCELMDDLSGAGIRSRFDEQKVSLPDFE